MVNQRSVFDSKPPVSRLVWVIYNTLGLRAPHPKPMSYQTNDFCRGLQTDYWKEYRKHKYGN